MTFGLQNSALGYQELLFHQIKYCPPSLAPDFEDLVVGLKELVNYLGEMLSDLGVIVFAFDEYCLPGLFLTEHPNGCEFQAQNLDFSYYH